MLLAETAELGSRSEKLGHVRLPGQQGQLHVIQGKAWECGKRPNRVAAHDPGLSCTNCPVTSPVPKATVIWSRGDPATRFSSLAWFNCQGIGPACTGDPS